MLGDVVKICIERTLRLFRIKPPESCGCEQRRQWLNLVWWQTLMQLKMLRVRITHRLIGQYRHQPQTPAPEPVVVDLDQFESAWDAMTVFPRDYFVTSDIDKANTLRLSGYRVEMKGETADEV